MSRIPRIGALAAGKDPADSLITRVMDLSQMTNDLGPDKSGVLGSDAHRIHRDHSASMLLVHLCCSVGGARRRADSSTNFAIPIFHPLGCPQARGLLGVEFIGSDDHADLRAARAASFTVSVRPTPWFPRFRE